MKKWIGFCLLFLLVCCPVNVKAATGSIKMQLPENFEGTISYKKVASMENGLWQLEEDCQKSGVEVNQVEKAEELEQTAKKLLSYLEKNEIPMQKCKGVELSDLEEGLYLMTFGKQAEIEMLPTLVSVPNWSGEDLVYEVTVIPKYVRKPTAPQTGWNSMEEIYLAGILLSLAAIGYFVWHNRRRRPK